MDCKDNPGNSELFEILSLNQPASDMNPSAKAAKSNPM